MSAWPKEIRLKSDRTHLVVAFDNGENVTFDAPTLRMNTPASGAKPKNADHVKITGLEPVGHYAVRIIFDDDHSAGLYTWDKLYALKTRDA